MQVFKRLAAVIFVLFSLIVLVCVFPVFALIFIATGADYSNTFFEKTRGF